ncbi:MAG: hypothetical protein NE334_01890 [Lentisphaeraceae bacterium]|nr:hypothetical protein [Lentisphaeraceae bacterium]
MKVEVFSLCDAATDQSGKLNILGCFDLICSTAAPVKHPTCAIALRIRFSKFEEGPHSVKITFTNDDGKSIVPPMTGDFRIQMAPDAVSFAQNLVFNMHGLQFPNFGDYSINLHIDESLVESIPLFLRQLPKNFKQQL